MKNCSWIYLVLIYRFAILYERIIIIIASCYHISIFRPLDYKIRHYILNL